MNLQDARKHFDIFKVLREAWDHVKQNLGASLLVFGCAILISLVTSFLSAFFLAPLGNVGAVADFFLREIMSLILGIGLTYTALKLSINQSPILHDLIERLHLFIKWVLATCLYFLAFLVGFIFFIIPGLIAMVRFSLFPYYLIDQSLGPIEALKKSWETTKGASWKLIGFYLLSILINLAGAFLFVIGLLITVPVTMTAHALVYRILKSQTYPSEPIEIEAEVIS
jgi:uncharacterized membrane protein